MLSLLLFTALYNPIISFTFLTFFINTFLALFKYYDNINNSAN